MSVAFSNDGSEAIHRNVTVAESCQAENPDWSETFQISDCAKWIKDSSFQRVALQFPDDLLSVSIQICRALQQATDVLVFVLADTAYGSCCVDEVAAEHHNADSIVHFGQACLSPTSRLPVFYAFGRQEIEISKASAALKDVLPSERPLLVLADVVYQHKLDAVVEELRKDFSNIIGSEVVLPKSESVGCEGVRQCHCSSGNTEVRDNTNTEEVEIDSKVNSVYGRTFQLENLDEANLLVVYLGNEGPAMTNWILHFKESEFYSYDPSKNIARKESVNVNKYLMKRYFLVEKAKDSQIVGILVGTLGVHHYLDSISRLKTLIKKAGKKSYTFVVGKVNVAKLANFMEIDIYVLVACPLNSLLDSSEFYRPVITPYEFELACNPSRTWTGHLILDFNQLLPGGSDYVEEPETYEEETDVSLVTGATRRLGLTELDPADGQLMTKETAIATLPSAGSFLAERSWKGLEQNLGKTPVTKATKGRKGIAISYEEEPPNEN